MVTLPPPRRRRTPCVSERGVGVGLGRRRVPPRRSGGSRALSGEGTDARGVRDAARARGVPRECQSSGRSGSGAVRSQLFNAPAGELCLGEKAWVRRHSKVGGVERVNHSVQKTFGCPVIVTDVEISTCDLIPVCCALPQQQNTFQRSCTRGIHPPGKPSP